ncbi:helix-turn-helix domain-containing protein [Paenibacillus allorhizosphaerae]|uniref:HTH-type transcriptional regulator YesS n=1 Tax=Paenibacillus allorhizosphaerae TaxID=2849866 RepID=A0ABM8V9V7_9BACL|nr:helix-turn-helix domain-containing protein [Paenibacillus allorhizosphaerae]CAG7614512.1 HTH-type transcriptional regulator YesS [Paenibacillus allorhizosphaerae]
MVNRRKSMFYKLFVSYVIIFATPLLVLGGIIYYLNVVNYQSEVSEANLTKLTQVRNQIDLELKSLREIVYHLSSELDTNNAGSAEDNKARLSMIVPQLEAYKEHYPFIDEIIYYQRGDTTVYMTAGAYEYSLFETGIKKDYDWTQASFFKELNSVSAPTTKRILEKESSLSKTGNVLAFMFPVPLLKTIPQGTVLFTIKESEFMNKFQNIFGNLEATIFIYDQYYSSLVSLHSNIDYPDAAMLEEQLRLIKGTGVSNMKAGNTSLTVTRMVSEETEWSYIVAMPGSFFYKRVNTMRTFIIGIMFILIMIGFIAALVLSKRNYRPIKALSAYFKSEEHYLEGNNELDMIRFTFESAIRKNQEMLVQMNAQRPFIKDQCLLTLLKGKSIELSERDYLIKCSNLMLNGDAYYCMALSVHASQAGGYDLGHLIALIENIYFAHDRCYGVEIVGEHYIAVIAVLHKYPEDGRSRQTVIAEELVRLAKDNLGMQTTIGIGKIYRSLEHVAASYLEASAVLLDNQVNAKSSVHFFDDIDAQLQQVHWFPIKEQVLLMQSLKQGDETVALETLKVLIGQITRGTASYLMIRCLCFDIVNQILKLINQMNLQNLAFDMKGLLRFNSLEEFQTSMETFVVYFCMQVSHYQAKKKSDLKNGIITYINDHYKDSDVSLEQIADRFNLSVSYLSRFVKEETGVNFVEYLTGLRIKEVKLQLQHTDKLIQDIVTDVGYLNIPSFVRKFKSLEGVTPGQYRQLVGR